MDKRESEKRERGDDDYDFADDFAKSILECYAEIKRRKENGGPSWPQDQ